MRSLLTNHPFLYTFGVAAVAFSAAFALLSYCLSSWLILPII